MNRPVTAQDLLCLDQLSDAQLSPDGKFIAYVRRTRNWETKSAHHQIWVAETNSRDGRVVSPDSETCTSPRWSPTDDSLVWLSHGSNGCRLQQSTVTAASSPIADEIELPAGTHNIAWSPDGTSIAFLAAEEPKDQPVHGIHEVGTANPLIDLCLIDVATRSWKRLTAGRFSVTDFNWHPSSNQLVICATPDSRPEGWDKGDAWIVPLNGAEARKLVDGRCTRALWSPDGTQLALVRLGQRSFLDTPTIEIHDLQGNSKSLDPFDEETQLLQWDEQGILALSVEGCSSHLYRIDPDSGTASRIMPHAPDGFSLIEGWFGQGCGTSRDNQQMAFTAYDARHPGEIALLNLASGDLAYITQALKPYDDWGLPVPETFHWTASDGTPLSGVLIHSNQGTEGAQPLVIALHGGPTAMASQAPFADNDWIWAAIPMMVQRGATVLLPDYRGSIGYGSHFRRMNEHRIGRANLDDIQSAIRALAAKGWVDEKRVGAVGASHGGYLAALLATATDSLAAAICRSGITDWTLNYELNQNPDWERQYFGGTPWEYPERYRAASPISYLDRASTPVLFIHGDQDRQAPTANAYALHRGLNDHGVPSRLIILQSVGHGGGSLTQLEHGINLTVEWFEQWLELT